MSRTLLDNTIAYIIDRLQERGCVVISVKSAYVGLVLKYCKGLGYSIEKFGRGKYYEIR